MALSPCSSGGPTHEVRAKSKLVWTMPYEKEEDERSDVNWDRFAVRGGLLRLLMNPKSTTLPPHIPHKFG